MRCIGVIHELETRRGGTTPGGLAEHLAGCPRCAARAEQMARLDRLWEATRPVEPPPAVWEAVWAKISAAADAAPASAAPWRLMAPARPWHRVAHLLQWNRNLFHNIRLRHFPRLT
jgi:hypothetical protein